MHGKMMVRVWTGACVQEFKEACEAMIRQKVEPLMAQSGLHELISSVSKWLHSLACRLY